MNKKIFLHIGRHKTGTSSLQHFLYNNRAVLRSKGFEYPDSGIQNVAHHPVARYFSAHVRSATNPKKRPLSADGVKEFINDVRSSDRHVIVSSEAFQGVDPEMLSRFFPVGFTEIIVYIREQFEYARSAYCQAVHARKIALSFEEYFSNFPLLDYEEYLERWERAFGKEHLHVRRFEKSHLVNGDIIDDFLDIIDLCRNDDFDNNTEDKNISIGGNLVEIKRLINSLDLDDEYVSRIIYKDFMELAASRADFRLKPSIDPGVVRSFRRSYKSSNQRVAKKYFNAEILFKPKAPEEEKYSTKKNPIEDDLLDVLEHFRLTNRRLFGSVMSALINYIK